MARFLQALMLLVITVGLVSKNVQVWGSPKINRPFEDIPHTYVYVQQALWHAMKEYNKASKDRYYFKVINVEKSMEQITDSLEYYLEVKIGRTMCRKIVEGSESCLLQHDPKMKKFAVNTFNQKSPDEYAYRTEAILSSWQEAVNFPTVYSMNLQLRKTVCKKFEESLDTCRFQERHFVNNTFICLFTVGTFPWVTEFKLYKQECS